MLEKLSVKPVDMLVILAAIFLTGFSVWKVYAKPQNASRVVIRGNNSEWVFPLGAEEIVRVAGPLGETVIRIHNRAAGVESSPCANQTCVAAGAVAKHGDWTACLPNNVFLAIENYDESGAHENTNAVDTVAW